MKKSTIKTLIFIISLLPIVGVFAMSFLKNKNIWESNYGVVFLVIFMVCVTYQVYYIMSLKAKKVGVAGVIFSATIACWIIYLLLGLYAFFFGVSINEGYMFEPEYVTYYGFYAMKFAMRFFGELFTLFIPILPISLIYIIIYTIYTIKIN